MKKAFGAVLLFSVLLLCGTPAGAQPGGTLRFCLRSEPKTLDPLLVEEDSSETVRYLTAGVLVRFNRNVQTLEPHLAASWKVLEGGRGIEFQLRDGLRFSDGAPLTSADVAYTIRRMLDPSLHSPVGDSFGSGKGNVVVRTASANRVSIQFPAPVAGLAALFDQVAVLPSGSVGAPKAVAGPFVLKEYRPGRYVLLERNPHYWKKDPAGGRMPYLDAVRLDIQSNHELELMRFRRGELHLINKLDPEMYERMAGESPNRVLDAGPSLESEQMWFNQVASAPIPAHKKAWFRSTGFRMAISQAISRPDICRIVYRGRAVPAAGPVSPANRFWFNQSLKPHEFDPRAAQAGLQKAGFSRRGGTLVDAGGNPVEFSLITNAGNKLRERAATMIQHDLGQIGIRVNVVLLDFPSLIERISRTWDYEACLLGLVNVDLDPNAQMNIWLSSASNHQWNPNQPKPATPWEAEVDRLMHAQASTTDAPRRKALFDQVQRIVWREVPFLYLVNRSALAAASTSLKNLKASPLFPQTFWNVEELQLAGSAEAK